MRKIALSLAGMLVLVSMYAQERPETAGPDVVSPSDNMPPKKEKLADKVKRYEAAGYRIGVNFSVPDLFVWGDRNEEGKVAVIIEETEPVCDCFEDKSDELVAKLNAQYNTTIFEKVDISKIPQKKALVMVDDWWKTKYKTVLNILIANIYWVEASSSNKKEITAEYRTNINMDLIEFIGSGKRKYIAQVGGIIFGKKYDAEEKIESTEGWTIADVREQVGGPTEDELSSAFNERFAKHSTKFFDKLTKK